MAKILKLDEMMQVLLDAKHPAAEGFVQAINAIGSQMADQIGCLYAVGQHGCTFDDPQTCGFAVAFSPLEGDEHKPCPAEIDQYDTEGDWE